MVEREYLPIKEMKTRRKRLQESLEQRVLGFIQEHHLVSSQDKLLVAVSGGPDSVCLLHILAKLQEGLGIKLHLAHLNHQLRDDESEDDAQYVSNLAQRLNISATIDRRDVKAYRAQQRTSLEEAAREVRYTFLAQVAKSIGANRVIVGHTTDDHIETILMHLIRGTGTKGLCGLQPTSLWQSSENSLIIIRPLLSVSREETASYCHHHKLMPRLDTSNLSLSPLRNRIRHQLLPLLKSYNSQVANALLRTARIANDVISLLDNETTQVWDEIALERGNTVILDKAKFLELPSALKQHLLRVAIEKVAGSLKNIETRHIEQIVTALAKPAGKRLNLPGGLIFSIDYAKYLISPDPAALSPFPILEAEFPLTVPGETRLPGWHVEATIIDPILVKGESEGALAPWETKIPLPLDKGTGIKGMGLINNDFTAYFDFNKTGGKLTVRPRQPGDRFQPLGMDQPKKLGEFMIDTKIPSPWRKRIPIVCSPKHILWVVGWHIDNRVKVTENTQQVLCLNFEQR